MRCRDLSDANDMPEFDPKDGGSMDWALTFGKAKLITDFNDEVDTPVDALIKILNGTLATKSEAVTGYRMEPLAEPGHYRIVQFAKKAPISVDTNYSTGHSYPPRENSDPKVSDYEVRKQHRTEVANSEWSSHGSKHKRAKTVEEARVMSHKAAQYLPDVNQKELEKLALQKGIVVQKTGTSTTKYFFYKSDKVIGFDSGVETMWIRSELTSGVYHGHPIAPARLWSMYGIK